MQKLPVIKICRLRHPNIGVIGPLVALTVPGRGNKALGFLMQVLGDAIVRVPEYVRVENTFFDFESSLVTSVEIVVTGENRTIDQVATDTIEAFSAAARWHAQHRTTHPTGVRTHIVQVIP